MKPRSKFLLKTILIVCLWGICIYRLYVDYDHEYLAERLIHTSLIIIASIVSAFAMYSDYTRYKESKKLTSFISTTTTFFCIAALLLTTYLLKKQDDTPTVLQAIETNKFLSNAIITIDFRENNTYKLCRRHFLSADFTRGHYSKKDSILILSKPDASEEFKSDRFVLRTIPVSDSIKKKKQSLLSALLLGKSTIDTTPSTYLFQINNKGEIIESAIHFKVIQN